MILRVFSRTGMMETTHIFKEVQVLTQLMPSVLMSTPLHQLLIHGLLTTAEKVGSLTGAFSLKFRNKQ